MNGRFLKRAFLSLVFAAPVLAPSYLRAQTGGKSEVAVLVTMLVRRELKRAQIEQGMAESVPTYKSAPGLIRKYFILSIPSENELQKFGGIYLWEDRGAEAWYTENSVFRAVVPKTTDLKAEITYFDVPIVTTGPVDASRAGSGRISKYRWLMVHKVFRIIHDQINPTVSEANNTFFHTIENAVDSAKSACRE